MTKRLPLQRKIREAWEKCCEDYNKCRINSERSLQAAFWFRLTETLGIGPDTPRRIFIEPHLRIDKADYYPDIVICNSRNVIGVIEIKHQPRKLPSFDKDLNTLKTLCEKQGKELSLRNRRYLGPLLQRANYYFSKDTVFAWAGVHLTSKESRQRLRMNADGVISNLMRLHLETSGDDLARIPLEN